MEDENYPRPGWLKRQAERIRRDYENWPEWKKEAARQDDERRRSGYCCHGSTPRMRRGSYYLNLILYLNVYP